MTTVAPPAIVNVVTAYSRAAKTTRAQVMTFVGKAWGTLDSYRDDDIDRFARLVAPAVEAGQRRMAAITDAYLAAIETAAIGTTVAPVGVSPRAATALRGVPTVEVYRRVGPTVWTALSRGVSLDGAVRAGGLRAQSLASTDMQLARTHTARAVMGSKSNVVGYRRVPTGATVCALCLIASTQRYRSDQLMPIHPGCSCDVEPIFGDVDPGRVIDPDRLDRTRSAIAERFAVEGDVDLDDYRNALIVHEHGEIGPVLAVRGHRFTSQADLPA